MKTLITALLIASASAGFAAQGAATATSTASSPWVAAVVKKVDKPNARVVLAHGALPNGMPPMTMSFQVKEAAWLDQMAPGQKIRFTIPANGAMTVESFEPVK